MMKLDTLERPVADLAPLPPDRAFVVEFNTARPTTQDDDLTGRVEHVISGRAMRFESAGELLDFVRDVLRSERREP